MALVAPVPDTAPPDDPCTSAGTAGTSTNVMTNTQGIARVCVIWPQDHSWWVDAQIEALASVAGTEFSAQQVFLLPALAEDIIDVTASPPNENSPYGPVVVGNTPPPNPTDCSEPIPGLP